jgi:hypothetical protein
MISTAEFDTFGPWSDAVTARPHERCPGVHVVTVAAGTARIEFPVTAGPVTEALAG